MFVRKPLTASLLIAVVFATLFVGRSASAQSTPAGTCTDVGYAGPIVTAQAVLQNASYSKPNTVGSALMYLIGIRYQYEDTVPPTGCESARPVIIQWLTLQEDALYLTMAIQADAANKDAYNDTLTNFSSTRIKAVTAALNNALGNVTFPSGATPAATLAAVATPSGSPQVCTDATFFAQVKTDTTSMNGGATTAVPFIKLRYKYEDLTAPAGCDAGRALLIQSLAITEDVAALSIMAIADSANASTYTGFLTNTVQPRAGLSGKTLMAAFPTMAPTAAATASS